MAVTAAISVLVDIIESISSENQAGPVHHLFDAFKSVQLDSGTGAGQVDLVWSDRRTLTASSSENLDLAGSLLKVFAGTATFVKVKLVILYNRTSGQTLSFKVGSSNGWTGILNGTTDSLTVKGGGFAIWYDPTGTTVTASTGDIVTVSNSSGSSMDYDIFILGTTA